MNPRNYTSSRPLAISLDEEMKNAALSVPVFNGNNYDFWSIKMRTYFKSQDLWETVEHGVREKDSSKEEMQKDATTLFTIQQALTDEVFPRIYEATSAKQAWDILQEEFRGAQEARSTKFQFYLEEFNRGLRMEGLETCQQYYSRLRLTVSRIRYYGGVVREKDVLKKLLQGLPGYFELIVKKITSTSARESIGCLEAFEMKSGFSVGRRGEGLRREVNDCELQ